MQSAWSHLMHGAMSISLTWDSAPHRKVLGPLFSAIVSGEGGTQREREVDGAVAGTVGKGLSGLCERCVGAA